MLSYASEILTQLLVRNNVTTTATGLWTDSVVNGWFNDAYRWAAAYKKWPFTEGRVTTTYAGTEENTYPEGWKSDSIRFLQVGGQRVQKLNFADYQIYREDEPDGTDKVFTDFGRTYFINPLAGLSGSTVLWGQYTPAQVDLTEATQTVFSDGDVEGNEAIVEEMLSYAKLREKLPNESTYHHRRAMEILEGVWKRYTDEQFAYQTKNRGMFKRIDVLDGVTEDELFHRDRWY